MKKTKAKDILFDSDIQLSSSKVVSPIMKYFDVLIAFIAVIGVTYVFISSYKIEVIDTFIIGAIISFVLLFSVIFKKTKISKYILIGTIITFSVSVFIFFNAIIFGVAVTWAKVAAKINENTNLNLMYDKNLYMYNYELIISLFLIFVIFIISALICFSIIYKPNFILILVVTVPILEIGLYFAIMPSYFSFELLIISWVAVFGMRTIKNKNRINKSLLQFKRKGKKNIYIVRGNKRIITTNVGIILGVSTIIIFLVTSIIYPSATYKPLDKMQEARLKIETLYDEVTTEKFIDDLMGVGQGGVNGGKLGTLDRIKYKNETALQVVAPFVENDIYLKGYTGCIYTGNTWEDVSDDIYNKYFQPNSVGDMEGNGFTINSLFTLMLNESNADLDERYDGKIVINNIKANNEYLYVPYNSSGTTDYGDSINFKFKKESSVYYEGELNTYSFNYYPTYVTLERADIVKDIIESTTKDTNSEFRLEERNNSTNIIDKYNKFVQEVYTSLPEEGLEEIKNEYTGRYNENNDINACINEAVDAVTADTTYDLAPGKLPKGKDFVEYFLYKNKKGYCSHYASSAAVILRAMGVPTRYVEGYVIKKEGMEKAKDSYQDKIQYVNSRQVEREEAMSKYNMSEEDFNMNNTNGFTWIPDFKNKDCELKYIEVKDNSAHAWIEVYIDNIGWVPVDVTPGFGDSAEPVIATNSTMNNEVNTNEINKEEIPKPEEVTPVENQKEENSTNNTELIKTENSVKTQILKGSITLIAVLILVIITISLRHKMIIIKRKKSYSSGDNNKNTHFIFKHLMEIFKYVGINNKDNLSVNEYIKFATEKSLCINKVELREIINICFKADFSKNTISKEELARIINFTNRFNEETYNKLSRLQKIKYTYVKNLR